MSLLKITLNQESLSLYLKELYPAMSPLELLKGGEVSQAFAFRVGDQELVIKLRDSAEEYKKEEFVAKLCERSVIPIPRLVALGEWSGLSYMISERASGNMLSNYTFEETIEVLPMVFELLERIHKVSLPHGSFGKFDENGMAKCKTWKDALLCQFDEEWYEWESFKEIPEMSDGTYEMLYGTFERLLTMVPEKRELIHTDCSFDNISAADGQITGLFDWEMAMYGDPLYDIAWMDFWHEKYDIVEQYLQWALQKEMVFVYFRERILCYQLHFGLRTLAFYQKAGLLEKILPLKERLRKMVNLVN